MVVKVGVVFGLYEEPQVDSVYDENFLSRAKEYHDLLKRHNKRFPSEYPNSRIVRVTDGKQPCEHWRDREIVRLHSIYKDVEWRNHWARHLHYTHISANDPTLIAFTASEKHGQEDRQTIIKPGKYLQRFAEAWFSASEIRRYSTAMLANSEEHAKLCFAKTCDEIAYVYEHGPSSCMSYERDNWNLFDSDGCRRHPTEAYGAGDLAIAYLEIRTSRKEATISARAICWPDKKVFGRVYGDGGNLSDIFENRLKREGFRKGDSYRDWLGARLLQIPVDKGFVCPFLDIDTSGVQIRDDGYMYLCMAEDSNYSGYNHETGYTDFRDYDTEEDEDDD